MLYCFLPKLNKLIIYIIPYKINKTAQKKLGKACLILLNIFCECFNKNKQIFCKYPPCLSVPAESTAESSPVKFWPVKTLPSLKDLDFQPH